MLNNKSDLQSCDTGSLKQRKVVYHFLLFVCGGIATHVFVNVLTLEFSGLYVTQSPTNMEGLTEIIFSSGMIRVYLIILMIAAAVYKVYLKFYKKSEKFMKFARRFPGPRRFPIIGTSYYYGTNTTEMYQSILRCSDKFGPVSGHWIGPEFCVLLYKPTDIEQILSNTNLTYKANMYRFVEPFLGRGLAVVNGELWRKQRKLITPTFHFKVLEDYVEVFNTKVKCLEKLLESEVDNLDFDIQKHIQVYAFDLICATAMTIDLDTEIKMEGDITVYEAAEKCCVIFMQRAMTPWLYPEFLFNISSIGKLQKKCMESIHKFTSQIISRKKEILRNKNLEEEENEPEVSIYGKQKLFFLDYLLKYQADEKNNLSDYDIQQEVKTFMLTGFDSTVSALGFISYELSKRFEVQEKIVSEITEVFGSLDVKSFTYYDLQNMKYLERVIKECLRIHTSVPLVARNITEDVELPSGYTLPKGSTALLAFTLLHLDPETYPNPREFNPDNFLPERIAARNPYSYCLFSAGPRNCIAQKYAMLNLKATVISIIRNFWLLPTSVEPIFAWEIALRSTTGIHVGLKRRTEERPIV